MDDSGRRWLRFLRQYGPIPSNDNMYDEQIQRSAKRWGFSPVVFDHPYYDRVLDCFIGPKDSRASVLLTGTAGDGKTHLCRKVWAQLGGSVEDWGSDEPYLKSYVKMPGDEAFQLHVIRDLSAWVPQRGAEWERSKEDLLKHFSSLVFAPDSSELFFLAANDGQLIETWRRLPSTPDVARLRDVFEDLLVENRSTTPDARLSLFNLSRISSARLLDLTLAELLGRGEWTACYSSSAPHEAFGSACPIRRNLELLRLPLVQQRLRSLFRLCDYNDLHIPIRHILLLISNGLLGHPDVKDRLLLPDDVPHIINNGSAYRASLYTNLFGGNLTDRRRESIAVFDYLTRFGIGYETSNRLDNILIFGEADQGLRDYFQRFVGDDQFYGADPSFRAAQNEYLEGIDEDEERKCDFLDKLTSQRRALFFKIPDEEQTELGLWELTVFRYAGEYLSKVVDVLGANGQVERPILARMVRGLNRIFVGMLVANDRDLCLATSSSFSHSRVSRLLEETVSASPRLGERVEIAHGDTMPVLRVVLTKTISRELDLNLTRYEFLSRVAEGALPNSFSKECYEDILAFKSQLLAALEERRRDLDEQRTSELVFSILRLDDNGNPIAEPVEVPNA